ncbi:MAG: (Fe-S)-binding protein [Limisphaerales bacterium]
MTITAKELPGLDCGACGFRTCEALAQQLPTDGELLKRCIYFSGKQKPAAPKPAATPAAPAACGACAIGPGPKGTDPWRDTLGREFDFYLDHFPSEPGPREIILPHNPLLTRELDVQPGDVLIGRPLGMSCGCPITHCGVAMQVDARTGVIVWCVTGPLRPRQEGYKDLGYYIAEGYEGLVHKRRCDLKIGMRYFFQPTMCMLQWRHSGLINYLNRVPDALQVRVEGLWIG